MSWKPPIMPDNLPTVEDIKEAYAASGLKPVRAVFLTEDKACGCPAMAAYAQSHPDWKNEVTQALDLASAADFDSIVEQWMTDVPPDVDWLKVRLDSHEAVLSRDKQSAKQLQADRAFVGFVGGVDRLEGLDLGPREIRAYGRGRKISEDLGIP